ncbi:uncharacterized protein G2W53_003634 [Senna tora]|uniref:Uncharacterized protein n=1 Tax=Senna tora TaxID=362788 RepID=A0A835CH75_9FABA|nr:uncharacterized protein G2W53_003634 [Senna tora]
MADEQNQTSMGSKTREGSYSLNNSDQPGTSLVTMNLDGCIGKRYRTSNTPQIDHVPRKTGSLPKEEIPSLFTPTRYISARMNWTELCLCPLVLVENAHVKKAFHIVVTDEAQREINLTYLGGVEGSNALTARSEQTKGDASTYNRKKDKFCDH